MFLPCSEWPILHRTKAVANEMADFLVIVPMARTFDEPHQGDLDWVSDLVGHDLAVWHGKMGTQSTGVWWHCMELERTGSGDCYT